MKKLSLILISILLVVVSQNCDEQAVDPPTEAEIAEAEQLVDSANVLLFDALLNGLFSFLRGFGCLKFM